MKKEFIMTTHELLGRISRELKSLCAGSAYELSRLIDMIILSDNKIDPVVAWAMSMGAADDYCGLWGSAPTVSSPSVVGWSDQYAECRVKYIPPTEDEGPKWTLWFTTTSGHGLDIRVTEAWGQSPATVEAFGDANTSERFWADDELAQEELPEARGAWFILRLLKSDDTVAKEKAAAQAARDADASARADEARYERRAPRDRR